MPSEAQVTKDVQAHAAWWERAIPDETVRREAFEVLAFGIENADDERSDSWVLRETSHGFVLMAGRLTALKLTRTKLDVYLMGSLREEDLLAIDGEIEPDSVRAIQSAFTVTIPITRAAQALQMLREPFDRFVDQAMARVRKRVPRDGHSASALAYVSLVVGRQLPEPSEPNAGSNEEPLEQEPDDDRFASSEPAERGRPMIFEPGQRTVASLVSDVERGVLALPDLQRPFVWEDTQIRDLLDSLFVGYPVGTLVFWHADEERDAKLLGAQGRARATTLVIDGQQRLTSLCAVVSGKEVTEREGTKRKITIAFRPRDGRFEVADATVRNNPEFVADVSELWTGAQTTSQVRRKIVEALEASGRKVDDVHRDTIDQNLSRAKAISEYRFPIVEIRKTANGQSVTDEDIADIFVRINNRGRRLTQADFVLTLLSVFQARLRERIETHALEMSRDAIVSLETTQVLRAACAVAFGRSRMPAIYRSLRGIDPVTGDADVNAREERLKRLDKAADETLDPTRWRDFHLRAKFAGFVSTALVPADAPIMNAYAFYVLGLRANVPRPQLDELISRWIFGTLVTARYSKSSDTRFEEDLSRVRGASASGFLQALDEALDTMVGGDYWTRTLVSDLETTRATAPAAVAFRAAQIVLGTRALFSDLPLKDFLTAGQQAGRSASEQHHLFPRAWLEKNRVERRRINQVANITDVHWHDNSKIGVAPPSVYVTRMRETLKLDDASWGRQCAEHALPLGWESMDYEHFLRERRGRMAEIMRVAFHKLGGEDAGGPVAPPWFLPGADIVWGRIGETEKALRGIVREVYARKFGGAAAAKIESALQERERDSLARALRSRAAGSDPLSLVDYLYLAQLPALLFASEIWADARVALGGANDAKQKLSDAVGAIAPVRNEIAHVREISPERLQRASLACSEILAMLRK